MDELWPYGVILVGAAATYMWRAIGVMFSGRVDPRSALFEWAGCVAYALLAGVVTRMFLLPVGPLAATTSGARIVAAVVALAIFFLTRRNLLAGVASGAAMLALLAASDFPI
jgi:branched-subunit amino acid transport protein